MAKAELKSFPLRVTEARENNLKEVSLELPDGELICLTGLSGSGKSSLAFDTVYAEGQRRYIETFSPYTRQFFDKVKRPDVTLMENVRPAIAIQQRTRVTNSRSTVGTMTNVNELLKVIWSNCATPFSPRTGAPLERWSPERVLHLLTGKLEGEAAYVLIGANVNFPRDLSLAEEALASFIQRGYVRVLPNIDGALQRAEELDPRDLAGREVLFILDRVRSPIEDSPQVLDSIRQAFQLSGDACTVVVVASTGKAEVLQLSSHFQSSDPSEREDRFDIPLPRPALFSFSSPVGACEECKGFGKTLSFDLSKIVPDPGLSLEQGAIACWNGAAARGEFRRLMKFCQAQGIDSTKAWRKLSKKQREQILQTRSREYRGVYPWFQRVEKKIYKMHVRVFLSRFRSQVTCPSCGGGRLKKSALLFKIESLTLSDFWDLPIGQALAWLRQIRAKQSDLRPQIREVFVMLETRLEFLAQLGLSYLTLARQSRTLSGGETQRVNLAAALGSNLVSTQFVLDEPSVGLHPRDTRRLLEALYRLRDQGNSLLVVEHDLDCINSADSIIELGPEAGANGGKLVYSGPASGWKGIEEVNQDTSGPRIPTVPFRNSISVKNATLRNLKNLSCEIPVAHFSVVTGVSGSGKSTLVMEVIAGAEQRKRQVGSSKALKENIVNGLDIFSHLLVVNQNALAKSPRANIATYSGLWDGIRKALAQTEAATIRSLDRSSFSFNVDGGRCPECKGAGFVKEDMQFLSDVYVRCEMCLGKRFQDKVLEVKYLERNAYEWLQTTVAEALVLLKGESQREAAATLAELGLGYLRLGHSLSELSGGEAQRLKLVPFLQRAEDESALLIFDEPTTGLHLNDVHRLIGVLHRLRDLGHTVLCVEHNSELILSADWIIDLGPESGERGGEVVVQGTPGEILKNASGSLTALSLREYEEGKRRLIRNERTGKQEGTSKKCRGPSNTRKGLGGEFLEIRGATEHNLKNIDLSIPHGKMVAITGISGSGKSTIAKDIIYAEGQRRYLDCLSPYARQFIRELKRPDIREIKNLRPTVCVYQHTFQPGTLSTVGTMSEVYSFLRLLFSKVGEQYCTEHPDQLVRPTTADEVAEKIKLMKADSVKLLAPVVKLKKGVHRSLFQRAIRSDIEEVRVDGVFASPSRFLDGLERNKVHSIEFTMARFVPKRIPEKLIVEAVAECFAVGGGTAIVVAGKDELVFSSERACPICNRGFFRPDPEDLSFHSRRGRCSRCHGTGREKAGGPCKECQGTRLAKVGRSVRIGNLTIADLASENSEGVLSYLSSYSWEPRLLPVVEPVLKEVTSRLRTLISLGLGYIELERSCQELSGGELQRLRLAAAMGTPLTGAMYIFDEPSAGLHPKDNTHVLKRLLELKTAGNSVLLIEHDEASVQVCEHVVEVGPEAGRFGGEITYNGPIEGYRLDTSDGALTCGEPVNELAGRKLRVLKGSCNNIADIKVEIPLGAVTTVAGVSGAGKSSLVHGIILETLQQGKPNAGNTKWQGRNGVVESDIPIDRVLVVDQSPIGRNIRSTPASYLKIWNEIRVLLAGTIEARSRGLGASFFSHNSGAGRCEACTGRGQVKLEMSFLTEASVACDLCRGRRFSDEALEIRYRGLNAAEILELTFSEAKDVFANHNKLRKVFHFSCDLGLGYLTLGQSSSTLSGGESQRIKLVSELARSSNLHTLYVLDEPTIGLHKKDVRRLLSVFGKLVRNGNTILLIEHDTDVIKASHHWIELGPGPGTAGGKVISKNHTVPATTT